MAIETIFFCPELFTNDSFWHLIHEAEKAQIELVQLSESAYSKCAYREGPDGLMALAKMISMPVEALRLPNNPLLLVVERVEKPGNIGALLRTADAVVQTRLFFATRSRIFTIPTRYVLHKGLLFSSHSCD
ncbi:MAG: hypothetical protein LR015_02250 [Verrucomicrobia bacterium]|nr:hypothetical protein [Verrucomicrobiota bacterium]